MQHVQAGTASDGRTRGASHWETARDYIGRPPHRELVPLGGTNSLRWYIHGWPSPVARWGYHPEFEIHLLQRGTGSYIVGDRIGAYDAGQLVLIGPNLPHHWISDAPPGASIEDRDMVLQFRPETLAVWSEVMPELSELDPLLRAASRGLEFHGPARDDATQALSAMGGTQGIERVQTFLHLLRTMAEGMSDAELLATPEVATSPSDGASDLVEQVLQRIYVHIDAEVRLSDLAADVSMSASTLSRYFTRATGQTIRDTVRQLRLVRARQLLAGTDHSVAWIASASGYKNLSNFNRQFLRDIGMTPREYRRSIVGG